MSKVKRGGNVKEWVAAVFAGGTALHSTAELQLMRNAVAWQWELARAEQEAALAQRAAQLEAELLATKAAQQRQQVAAASL